MSQKDFSVVQCADPKMKNLLQLAENVAASKASILIHGESGTGKELLARFIHAKSHRANKQFFAINCAAVPEGLLESELFGYEKGAFTGAEQRRAGLFEQASGSTFLLDEISEMPLVLQAKLLRVLQEGEVVRLGSSQPTKVNVRIIATSNRNMREMVARGEFREDLFYRLNVIPLGIPALRERPQDLQLLTNFFVALACEENGLAKKQISLDAMEKIMSWSWPGNVRELRNTIERAVLISQQDRIEPTHIMLPELVANNEAAANSLRPGMTVAEAEKLLIIKTLEFTRQNRTKAADLLGISIRTLRNKINEYRQQEVTL